MEIELVSELKRKLSRLAVFKSFQNFMWIYWGS